MIEIAFFLKKLIGFFLEPFGVVTTLLVLGIFALYKQKTSYAKLFLLAGTFLLLLFSYPPFANLLVTNLESKYSKYTYSEDVKYIHVLGNGHTTDKDQPISSQISDGGTKRVLEGVIIYKNMPNAKLIFTGYEGSSDTTNAQMNARLALALGVKKEDIIINGKPVDTQEEAEFTRTLVADEPFVLVTSATHMPRAMMLFESLGMHPTPAPTNFYKFKFEGYLKKPTPMSFHISTLAVHEYLGILWAKLRS